MPAAPLRFAYWVPKEVEYFGKRVLPLVRELEARLPEPEPALS
ncbi:hypothetical protein PS467_32735 [Streptomyces luomodiensis]|uniref:Uncharacterized protein n=1 Tax=Streptomyces luomodiensis TaxID=3026192 RepID=A0ABY9VAP8_9ACTN|nr:hypothetical protein [Streptomyces sp. SCA4-21]WNF01874.1 hypothetical protein PS467_32735 [Streptomyces sp. SCA4-21]